jgi:hypothetical protein
MANNTNHQNVNNSQHNNIGGGDSFEIASRLPNNTPGRVTIEVNAPYRVGPFGGTELNKAGQHFPGGGLTHDVHNTAVVKIDVQVLKQNELGLLNATGQKLEQVLATAMKEKHAEDERKFHLNPAEMVKKSQDLGYYGSGAHQAWAEAASARTGGKASPEYMMKLDPLGGTNGNGPKIELGGIYPHQLSRIAMGHDTDWSLGRYFNAGPLNGLYKNQSKDDGALGMYGLQHLQVLGGPSPINPQPKAQYAVGNDIYKVYYNEQPTQSKRAGIDGNDGVSVAQHPGNSLTDASLKTAITAKDFGERANHFNQALSAANGNVDVAAAVLKSSVIAGHNHKDEINVAVSTKDGALIATQGTGPGAHRAEAVLPSQVQPGTAQNVAEALTQKNPVQQIAAVEPQVEKQTQAPRTM